jgi:hypothetical protein
MPSPLMVSINPGMTVIVNRLAPELNTMLLTSVSPRIEGMRVFETSKVAMSSGPLGTVAGIQCEALFQLPSPALSRQVALSARVDRFVRLKTSAGKSTDLIMKGNERESAPGLWTLRVMALFLPAQFRFRQGKTGRDYRANSLNLEGRSVRCLSV